MRDTLLLSHANPEDSEFTLWLALQLASNGFRVWCDLTKLLGGEVFWDDIEAVLRDRAVKVIYILSRTSNAKDGPLRELSLAQSLAKRQKLHDFVIPIHLDNLPPDEVTIELSRVNWISADKSWAQGLDVLLKKLEEEGVPRNPAFNKDAVTEWWRSQYGANRGVLNKSELIVSNWFKVEDLPSNLYEHRIARTKPGVFDLEQSQLPYPGIWLDPLSILTFAEAADFSSYLAPLYLIHKTREIKTDDFISGKDALHEGARYLAQLLRLAWDECLKQRLHTSDLADGRISYFFRKDDLPDDTVYFIGADGKKSHRSVVGYKTMLGGKLRYWHYAISGKPIIRPETLFLVKGHVRFSDDGINLWTNKDQAAKARRNQCANWWNDEWRDRLYAAMSFLAGPDERLIVPLGDGSSFALSKQPMLFESPVSYLEPGEVSKDETLEDYEQNEDELADEVVAAEVNE